MAESLKFDHYEVLLRKDGSFQELGRGAMGVTYKAFDSNLRIPVALKVINAATINSDLARQRFVREARAAAALRHPNVASVFHLGIEGDAYFYAMEYVEGETIESLIRRNGPVDPVLAVQIVIQVARALNAAAKLELVHRDIKPANLMVLHQDEELVVKVIDFGLAKSSKGDGEDLATVSMGGFVGTPHFASPEQLEEKDLDVRSDIYSLGVTLWYMLAGRTPFGGTLAQVMSQHLSKIPPFEQLDLPSPVVYLLKRMLAKDPAERFQTPVELRREAEKCLETLRETETVVAPAGLAASAVPNDEEMATLAADNFATIAAEPPRCSIGTVIANRYEVIQELDASNFVGRIKGSEEQVQLILLRKDLSPASFEEIQSLVGKTARIAHPNLLRAYGVEDYQGSRFIVFEAVPGCSLVELLRARRQLTPQEASLLLEQAAEGGDCLREALGTSGNAVDFALDSVRLAMTDAPQDLLKQPMAQWPVFALKLRPIRIEGDWQASGTWSGERTLISPGKGSDQRGAGFIRALGFMMYELLGGNPQLLIGSGTGRYVPLAVLSEEGNAVLRRALESSESFGSGKEFAGAFKAEIGGGGRGEEQTPRVPEEQRQGRAAATASPTLASPGRRKGLLVGVGLVVVVGAIALAAVLFRSPSKTAVDLPAPKPAGVQASAEVAQTAPKNAAPTQIATPVPTPAIAVATPAPTPVLVPTPTPTPTQEEVLKARLDAVKQLEADKQWKRCLHEYVQIEKDFPQSDAARVGLELVIPKLAEQLGKYPDLSDIREDLTFAARTDIVSAMMLLGHSLQKKEPAVAFSWFQSAAEKGQAPAMTQEGLMYSSGLGVSRDLNKAFGLFEQAADKGDSVAKTCLGECYLYGLGTPKNEKKAISFLREAADANEPRGMNLLGTCYHQGLGTPKDFPQALQLFKKAAEAGFADALGNEGVLYMTGEGVNQKDEHQAVELFQKGADAGSSYSMFLLGQCYEAGIGVDESRSDAVGWYRKSARGGNPRAVDWCRRNQVDFN